MTCEELEKEVKELQSHKKYLNELIGDLKNQHRSVSAKIVKKVGKLKKFATTETVRVSDHATLRFAERRYGLNVDALKAEMLAEIGPIKLKDVKCNGYVIKDSTVVTYLPNGDDGK